MNQKRLYASKNTFIFAHKRVVLYQKKFFG